MANNVEILGMVFDQTAILYSVVGLPLLGVAVGYLWGWITGAEAGHKRGFKTGQDSEQAKNSLL